MNLKIAMNTFQDETENKDQKREKISNLQKNNNCSSIYMKQVQQMIASVEGHQKLSEELMVENYTNLITTNP